MDLQVTVPLSEKTYARVKQWAELRQQDMGEAIAGYLTSNLPDAKDVVVAPAEEDEPVQQEMEAYIRLHPELKKTHFGKHVAVYGGQLIDTDDDFGVLFERIDVQYPDEFVWMTQVKEEPIETLHVRSIRLDTQ